MILRKIYYTLISLKNLSKDTDDIRRFQKERLSDIVEVAYQNSPYYRKIMEKNELSPENLITFEDLKSLPVTDKETIRNEDLTTGKTVTRKYTSTGTTGEEFRIPYSEQASDWREAVTIRSELLNGFRPPASFVEYRGLEQSRTGNLVRPKKLISKESSLEDQLNVINQVNPEHLLYESHILFRLAKMIETGDKNLEADIVSVFCRGEILTDNMKEKIREVFSTEVYNLYETSEVGQIGWDCPEGGFHINEDLVYTEILNQDQNEADKGEAGHLIVTGLVNDALPLIRYKTGDIVRRGKECSCKTTFKKLKAVEGREENILEDIKGETVYPREIIDSIAEFPEIKKFVITREEDSFTLKYQPTNRFTNDTLDSIEYTLSNLGITDIQFKEKESIARSGGKANPVRFN